jgi:hypothetical protein
VTRQREKVPKCEKSHVLSQMDTTLLAFGTRTGQRLPLHAANGNRLALGTRSTAAAAFGQRQSVGTRDAVNGCRCMRPTAIGTRTGQCLPLSSRAAPPPRSRRRRAAAAGKLHDAPNAAAVGNLPQVAAV